MSNCFYCDKNEKLDSLMLPVCELEYSIVYLVKNQNHPGRCVVAYKEHKRELYELSTQELAGFSGELSLVAKALSGLYHADKMNYGIYGDGVPHLHCHVVPKRQGEYGWGSPFSLQGGDVFPPEQELKAAAQNISQAIAACRQ